MPHVECKKCSKDLKENAWKTKKDTTENTLFLIIYVCFASRARRVTQISWRVIDYGGEIWRKQDFARIIAPRYCTWNKTCQDLTHTIRRLKGSHCPWVWVARNERVASNLLVFLHRLHVSHPRLNWRSEIRDAIRTHDKLSIREETQQYKSDKFFSSYLALILVLRIRKKQNTARNQVLSMHEAWKAILKWKGSPASIVNSTLLECPCLEQFADEEADVVACQNCLAKVKFV